jgi:hypothetical protein
MSTIDMVCSLPAPTLAQVRAWLTRSGWYAADAGPLGREMHHERWSHDVHGSAWVPCEELSDWLAYVSTWIVNRAWQISATPEAVYRDIVGPAKVWALCHRDGSTPDLFARESEAVRARKLVAHSRVEECEVQP